MSPVRLESANPGKGRIHERRSSLKRIGGVDARTWLFDPGDRPHQFSTPVGAEADAVVLDLWGTVAPENVGGARSAVASTCPRAAARGYGCTYRAAVSVAVTFARSSAVRVHVDSFSPEPSQRNKLETSKRSFART
jgi:hypothetical protein